MSDVIDQMKKALAEKIPDATIEVTGGGGGHFVIEAVSPVFEGKSRLESQRLVLNAIRHLMAGENAPVHAIDAIKTRAK